MCNLFIVVWIVNPIISSKRGDDVEQECYLACKIKWKVEDDSVDLASRRER